VGGFLTAGGAPGEAAEEACACLWLPEAVAFAGDGMRWGCSRARGDGGTSSCAGEAGQDEGGGRRAGLDPCVRAGGRANWCSLTRSVRSFG
jgi:hypothetical protein